MADNFDMKKFLAENKLGPFSRNRVIKEVEEVEEQKPEDGDEVNESEKYYFWGKNGKCYVRDDENNEDEVNAHYCKSYADNDMNWDNYDSNDKRDNSMYEGEGTKLTVGKIYDIKDPGDGEVKEDFKYLGKALSGEHVFQNNEGGSPTFMIFTDEDVADLIEPSLGEGLEEPRYNTPNGIRLRKLYADRAKELGKTTLNGAYPPGPTPIKKPQTKPLEDPLNENDSLSPEGFERASGLVKTESIRKMIEAAEDMMNTLTDEGFEVEEVREFFTQLISNDI